MSPPNPSVDTLRQAADGSVRAQEQLFDAWLPVVLRWCARLGGPKVDYEDAAHDVFIVVLRRLDSLEQPDRFSSWLYGITRRVLRKHRTRAWVQRWSGSEMREVGDPSQDLDADVHRSQTTRQVQDILAGLPEKQREVLVLCELEERTAPEVAEILDIPVGTVASRLRLGRTKFERLARARSLHVQFAPAGDLL